MTHMRIWSPVCPALVLKVHHVAAQGGQGASTVPDHCAHCTAPADDGQAWRPCGSPEQLPGRCAAPIATQRASALPRRSLQCQAILGGPSC